MHTLRAGLANTDVVQHLIGEQLLQHRDSEVVQDPVIPPLVAVKAGLLESGLLRFAPSSKSPLFSICL